MICSFCWTILFSILISSVLSECVLSELVSSNVFFRVIFIPLFTLLYGQCHHTIIYKSMKIIDYTLVDEYLDSLLEDDPAMLMNGITPLYLQVAKHFRPKDRKHSIYSRQSIREAVRTYFDEHNVDHKIAVKLLGHERKGMTYSPEHRAKIGAGVKKTWSPEKRAAQSRRIKECWEKRRNK